MNRFPGDGEVALRAGRALLSPRKIPVDLSVTSGVNPMATERLEGLGELKKKYNDVIGNRTRDLPACRTEPQPAPTARASTTAVRTSALLIKN
jgi:hypothetical protein